MIVVRTRRDGLLVTGRDASSYLHSQLSQDVAALATGESKYAFALDPGGKVVALCRVTRLDEDRLLIDVESGFGEVLRARLERFRIRVDVSFAPVVVRCTSWRGVDGPPTSDGPMVAAWWGDGTSFDELVIDPDDGSDVGRSAVVDDDESPLEEARVGAVWPRLGHEIVPGETLPASTGVVAVAVSFVKGCYPGQELVERMDSRGASAPTVLRRFDVWPGVAPGDDVIRDGRVVGRVTSVAGGGVLALVKRTEVD